MICYLEFYSSFSVRVGPYSLTYSGTDNSDLMPTVSEWMQTTNAHHLHVTVKKSFRCKKNGSNCRCHTIQTCLAIAAAQTLTLDGFEHIRLTCLKNIFSPKVILSEHLVTVAPEKKVAESTEYYDYMSILFAAYVATGIAKTLNVYIGDKRILPLLTKTLSDAHCDIEKLQCGFPYYVYENVNDPGFYNLCNETIAAVASAKLPQTLKRLSFSVATNIVIPECQAIATLLNKLVSRRIYLEEFVLGYVVFDQTSLDAISHYISLKNACIKRLEINSLCVWSNLDFENFANAVATNHTLGELSLNNAVSSLDDAVLWRNCILANTSISDLSFAFSPSCAPCSDDYFSQILIQNHRLKRLHVRPHYRQLKTLAESMRNNYTICRFSNSFHHDDPDEILDRTIAEYLQRNNAIVWQKSLHNSIVDYCITMRYSNLPPYVLLWIHDWLPPWMHLVSHHKKIALIQATVKSIGEVYDRRVLSRKK